MIFRDFSRFLNADACPFDSRVGVPGGGGSFDISPKAGWIMYSIDALSDLSLVSVGVNGRIRGEAGNQPTRE